MVKKRLAEQIIENVGSVSNISSIAHCMTRLRLKVKDESKVNTQVIPKLEGVMKFLKVGDQYQIVLGAIVDDVFDEVSRLCGDQVSVMKEVIDENLDSGVSSGGSRGKGAWRDRFKFCVNVKN